VVWKSFRDNNYEEFLMAITPVYHWPTPDDAAQVRQGASAMRSLGNAIDKTMKAVADHGHLGDALDAGVGGAVHRNGTLATASNSNNIVIPFDAPGDERGGASSGQGGVHVPGSGLYIVTGWLELGTGTGGHIQWVVREGSLAVLVGGFARQPGVRASTSAAIVHVVSSAQTFSMHFTTDAAMTITGARMSVYKLANR
jgi:hypothetical protein